MTAELQMNLGAAGRVAHQLGHVYVGGLLVSLEEFVVFFVIFFWWLTSFLYHISSLDWTWCKKRLKLFCVSCDCMTPSSLSSLHLPPQFKPCFLVNEECCPHVLVTLHRHESMMKIKPVCSNTTPTLGLYGWRHCFNMCLTRPPSHPPPLLPVLPRPLFPSTSSSSRGVYRRTQRFLGLLSGGSRAARMASSNTFFSPLWEKRHKEETTREFPSQPACLFR